MVAPPVSDKQTFRFEAWKSAYMHLGGRAVSLNDLRLQGTAACVIQMVVTTTLPIVWYFLLYREDSRLVLIPIVTWATTALTGCLGVAGFVLLRSLLLGMHAVVALALASALGVFDTVMYMSLSDRSQASFAGCSGCACALGDTCTQAQLQSVDDCRQCKAWGTDVCTDATGSGSALPYMGLIELVLISAPAVFSFMVLMRMERERSDTANRLTYARGVVSRELRRLEAQRGLNVDLVVFRQLLTTVIRYGGKKDREAAVRCCRRLNLDPDSMASAAEFDDAADEAGGGGANPSFKVGEETMAGEDYIIKHQNYLNSSFTHTAPPATPVLDYFDADPTAYPGDPGTAELQGALEAAAQQQDPGRQVLRLPASPPNNTTAQIVVQIPGGVEAAWAEDEAAADDAGEGGGEKKKKKKKKGLKTKKAEGEAADGGAADEDMVQRIEAMEAGEVVVGDEVGGDEAPKKKKKKKKATAAAAAAAQ